MKKALIALLVLGMAAVSQADIIAQYTFDSSAATSSDTAALSTASALSISAGTFVYTTTGSTAFGALGATPPAIDRGTWGTGTTFGNSVYWFFTVTVDPGYVLNVTSFDFLGERTGAGPQTFGWSINGVEQGNWTPGNTLYASFTDTPGAEGLNLQGTVTIGLHAYNATSTGNFRVDNVILNGAIAIPEPGVLALLGLGLGALIYVRRNRK